MTILDTYMMKLNGSALQEKYMPNDADLWFEHSLYCMRGEIENVRGVINQISPGYRTSDRLELEAVRTELDKLIEEWAKDVKTILLGP